ncbi:MAG: hypothetical protein ACYTAF_11890, partial [Planctomycetota bacterium]|jgi:hypothetical protein
MTALLCLLLVAPLPGQADPRPQDESPFADFPAVAFQLGAATLWTDFDSELDLERGDGGMLELQMRLDDAYYYKIAAATMDSETDDALGEDVDIWSVNAGFGMDLLFGSTPHFSLDAGAGLGLQRFSSDGSGDTGWFWQVEFVARAQPLPWLSFRGGAFVDFVRTSFPDGDTEIYRNWSFFLGVEINY